MSIKPLDTLLAIKILSLVPGLTTSDRRVGATLLEHFNRRTNRCDPSLDRIAAMLGISTRTVMRSNNKLVGAGLFHKVRHGGFDNRNLYAPIWSRFVEHEDAWRQKMKQRSHSRPTKMSPEDRQDCHMQGDSSVYQTCTTNLINQTYSSGLPKKEATPRTVTAAPRASGKPSFDAARDAAEGRWLRDVDAKYRALPTTYSEIIDAITDEIRERATDAELQRRSSGLVYIEKQLRLPP